MAYLHKNKNSLFLIKRLETRPQLWNLISDILTISRFPPLPSGVYIDSLLADKNTEAEEKYFKITLHENLIKTEVKRFNHKVIYLNASRFILEGTPKTQF